MYAKKAFLLKIGIAARR